VGMEATVGNRKRLSSSIDSRPLIGIDQVEFHGGHRQGSFVKLTCVKSGRGAPIAGLSTVYDEFCQEFQLS
jgi:hypothetical protein